MTRKPKTINFWCGRLPHWEVEDGRYFVTLHLAGAIPQQGQEQIHALAVELQKVPKTEDAARLQLHRRIFAEMEKWLDRAEQVRHLQQPEVATMIRDSVGHRQDRVWNMFEFVVMPNHVHLFFEILSGGLKDAVEDFKRWTGHQAANLVVLDNGRFWQDEWFDHWSRSDEEDDRIVEYIRHNPVKAGLVMSHANWPYGGWQ